MILGIIAFFIGVMIGVAVMCILYVARDRADKETVKIPKPLPKPHGNLIDREDLLERLAMFRDELRYDYIFVVMIVKGAGVIVEAEGED